MAAAKFWTKKRIIILIAALLVVAAIVVTTVVLVLKNNEVPTAEESVARGSLSSSISSSGTVVETGVTEDIPFYAALNGITDADALEGYADNFSWTDYFVNAAVNDVPLYYEVVEVNGELAYRRTTMHTSSDEILTMFKVVPIYLDYDALRADYEAIYREAIANDALPSDTTLTDFILNIILTTGGYDGALPDDFRQYLIRGETETEITSAYPKALIEATASPEETGDIEYAVYNFNLYAGQYVGLDTNVFTVSVTQLYTSFTVTEYDVASIDLMLREAQAAEEETGVKQGVYAAVSINALGGRRVIAEILEILNGSYSSGVSYYSVRAKIVFGAATVLDLTVQENAESDIGRAYLAANPDAAEMVYLDYGYYDPALSAETVGGLGVDIYDILSREEVLSGYSVAVRVPQEVVYDSLIVSTQCVFYDGENRPYVIVRDGSRERRVYVRILLSTGTEAAVEAQEGYELNEGDRIIYRANDSLLSSILG